MESEDPRRRDSDGDPDVLTWPKEAEWTMIPDDDEVDANALTRIAG